MVNALKLVVWVGVGICFLLLGTRLLFDDFFILAGIFIASGVWVLLSIKMIGPTEMAVLVFIGQPVAFRDSGLNFVPFLFANLVRFPKKMYNFNYRARKVVTRAGYYDGVFYGAQVLKVDAAAYLNFPREFRRKGEGGELVTDETTHPLIKILRSGVPVSDKELELWTEEAVVGALRVAFGRITWRQAIQDPGEVTKQADDVFKDPDGPLSRAGFSRKGIQLVVAEIHLPPELEEALPKVDTQRLEAESARFEARQIADETGGAVVENFARLSGMDREAVEKALREDPMAIINRYPKAWREALNLTRRQQAIKGKSFLDIRVRGAKGIEETLINLIGVLKRMPRGGEEETAARSRKPQQRQESFEESIRKIEQSRQKG